MQMTIRRRITRAQDHHWHVIGLLLFLNQHTRTSPWCDRCGNEIMTDVKVKRADRHHPPAVRLGNLQVSKLIVLVENGTIMQ